MNFQIAPMDRGHLPQVAALETLCFSAPWSAQMLAGELERDNTVYLVAQEETGAVWGYAGFYTVLDEGCITNVAVHPDGRRQGIGRRLVQALLEAARMRALVTMTLEVREHNTAARRTYLRQGLTECGRRPHYYEDTGEDAILMRRSL